MLKKHTFYLAKKQAPKFLAQLKEKIKLGGVRYDKRKKTRNH